MAAKAKIFMGEAWNKGPGNQIVRMVSGGGNAEFGEVMEFTLTDAEGEKTSPYIVTLSKSGHVIRVKRSGNQSGSSQHAMDVHQGAAIAEEWMKRWSDERLTLIMKAQSSTSIQLVYIPVREQVPIPQMKVVWRFDPRTGQLSSFDASEYYRDYNKTFTLRPKLTAEQAVAALNPNLRAAGTPKLEIHEGTLVYEIPVTGVEGVKLTYVNALNGNIESIAYNS